MLMSHSFSMINRGPRQGAACGGLKFLLGRHDCLELRGEKFEHRTMAWYAWKMMTMKFG